MPDVPIVGDPNYWPHPVGTAAWDDGAQQWVVQGTPPEPWPYVGTYPLADYGPPGTLWQVPAEDYAARYVNTPLGWLNTVAKQLLKRLKLPDIPPFAAEVNWYVPGEVVAVPATMWRVTVHAKLGTVEEAANVLHYIDGQGGNANRDDTEVGARIVADLIRGYWSAFLASPCVLPAGILTIRDLFAPTCTWDEVRVARVTLNGYPKGGKANGTVNYNVDTQYSPFPLPLPVGGGTQDMPYEVACAVSLGTGVRGPSHRGRIYLGPLNRDVAGPDGLFQPGMAQPVANAFKAHLLDAPATLNPPLQLVVGSVRLGSAFPVTQVRVGVVPDSQRRRRRSQAEDYHVAV